MLNLTKTFTQDQFHITPIMMDEQIVFVPQEIEDQLGYSDLSNVIRHSEGFVEEKDYVVVEGEKLRELKEIFHRGSSTTSVKIAPNVNSLVVITESGFWGVCFRSNKPECVALRIWVTSEVLPAIRRTGQYAAPQGQAQVNMVKVEKLFSATKRLAKGSGMPEVVARKKAAEVVKSQTGVDRQGESRSVFFQNELYHRQEIFVHPGDIGNECTLQERDRVASTAGTRAR